MQQNEKKTQRNIEDKISGLMPVYVGGQELSQKRSILN